MSSNAPSPGGGRPLLSELQGLYDRHRFQDTFAATAALWTPATEINRLSTEEIVFAARLAIRLGGLRLARGLFWTAHKREPAKPLVRYFTDHLPVPRKLLLDDLLAFEAQPDLGGGDTELRANWLAAHAHYWASLRNIERAKQLLEEAQALNPDSSWLYAMEADVMGLADNWQVSLRAAERAWELDKQALWSARSLAAALMNAGRIEEAVGRLEMATAETQSAELVQTACWYQCAFAELLEGDERAETMKKARALAERIEPLAPLADREFKSGLARIWLDIAHMDGNHAEMERWAKEARSPFHRQVLANLKQNPGGKRIRLPYRRTLQKHLECVPASVGSALSATGIEISVEDLAADVTFGGTVEWAAADWLRDKGLHVRFFPVTTETTTRLLEAGIGFVVTWNDDQSGHAVAIVGVDHGAGIALAHDPTSFRATEYLLRVFDDRSGPLGVLGMAAVSRERAEELDTLLPDEATLVEAAVAHAKALVLFGPPAAHAVLTKVAERFPSHPGTRYLQAIQDLEDGRMGRALQSLRELFNQYPNAPEVRVHLIHACRSMGNTVLLRHTLQTVVETGAVPGVESKSDWVRPHSRYVCEYADMLRASSETRHEAENLLRSVLKTQWASASGWHVLADMRWERRETGSALLAYSVASFLAEHNEHYARAYADALSHCRRTEEGLQWLENRVRRLGGSAQGVSTWTTWIGTLEDHGFPERAIAACQAAITRHGSSTILLAFTIPFLGRMGRWEEAEQQLAALATSESKGARHEAAVAFHRMRGEPEKALRDAESWMVEAPRSMQARYALLRSIDILEGKTAAALRAEEWMRDHPGNEDFEEAFCQYAQNRFNWRQVRVLRRRVQRNREDGWAWRELAFNAMNVFDHGDKERKNRLRPRIEEYLAEADRVAHDNAATTRAHGLWKEVQEDWRGAVACNLEAISSQPDHFYAYRRAWECSARLPDQERRALWAVMARHYLENSAHLPNALEMMRLLAERLGVREAEKIVTGWQLQRPDDPGVVEAAADLLLDHGHGRSDALRALDLLRGAVERFPYHSGLRLSLARAWRATGNNQGAKEAFEELVRRRPDDNSVLIQLAWIQHQEGETEQALQTLDRASAQHPQEPGPLDNRAQILLESGRIDEARDAVNDGLRRLPESVRMYERAIALLKQCGLREQAVQAARRGIQTFPHGAYLWLLLGRTLKEMPEFAAPGEIEACLRRSLKGNRGLYDSADWMTMFLVEQQRYKEATDLLEETEAAMADPSPALGRRAWVKRQSGEKQEAVTDLAAVLRDAPWYAWGWNLLMTWLEEDKNWTLSRELLENVPPPMLTDVGFRQRRLLLLEKAKVEASRLDGEWSLLLDDFPEEVSLHLRRYDSLLEAKRSDDASAVLRRVVPIAGNDVYLLARLVGAECRERKYKAAMDDALAVCFARVEQSPWPANQVWDQMRKAGMAQEFSEQFFTKLKEGARPTQRALVLYAEQVLERVSQPRYFKWLLHSRLSATTRKITAVVRLVEQSRWVEGSYLAELMKILNRKGYRKQVIHIWNRMRVKGLATNTDAWAQTGVAMINTGQKGAAKQLLQDWRTRPGVAMWVLTNYILSLSRSRRSDLNEVIATCREGLIGLPHDHCARHLAYMEAEACILAGNKQGLLDAWDKYASYFEGQPKKGEHFPASQTYLLSELPVAVRILAQHDDRAYAKMVWRLRLRRLWNKEIRAKGKRYFILLFRAVIVLWILGTAIASIFK